MTRPVTNPDSITHDELRPFQAALAHALAYRREVAKRPPRPEISVQAMCDLFGGALPEQGEDGVDVIHALAAKAERGLMAMTGRRFFGWVIGASHPVGVAADWLTSAWGQNAAFFAASPAAATAEKVAGDWILDLLDLPRASSVGFVTGATMANFTCLAAARHAQYAALGWDVEADGLCGAPPLQIFVGEEAHASVFSALQHLGLGAASARRVPSDDQGRMDSEALHAMLADAPGGGKIIIAQAGHINSGAFDPLARIAELARMHGAWLHIDGAFGLWARACDQTRCLALGAERADSWATDGHKWLQLPYDSGIAIVAHAEAHRRAMNIEASYLPDAGSIEHNPGQYVPELSRRARGFAAWAMLRALGRAGVAEMVGRHCALAKRLARALETIDGVEILNDIALNQVAIGFGAGAQRAHQDALTRATITELQRDNVCFAAGGVWKGREIMRVSVIAAPLEEGDIDCLASAIAAAFARAKARMCANTEKEATL